MKQDFRLTIYKPKNRHWVVKKIVLHGNAKEVQNLVAGAPTDRWHV
jgi:hypothetical protein